VSLASDERPFPPALVCVVDTGVLIDLKFIVPIAELWGVLEVMKVLVADGHLAFPRQVDREMKAFKHSDAPGAWAAGCNGHARHREPSDDALAEVMGIAQLTDPEGESEFEVADPYVVAMAYDIAERHQDSKVVVATKDYVDRMPNKESIGTACDRLGLQWWKPPEFLEWVRGLS
jgi:hypothetical protein